MKTAQAKCLIQFVQQSPVSTIEIEESLMLNSTHVGDLNHTIDFML